MRHCLVAGIGIAAALVAGTSFERAQGAGEEGSPLVSRIALSGKLTAYGRSFRDPLALIVAARVLHEAGLTPRKRPAAGTGADDRAFPSPQMLLAEARSMARGRRDVARLADNALASTEKGRLNGPLYEIAKLGGGARVSMGEIRFTQGERAEIYVEGTRKVTIAVIDAEGKTICQNERDGEVAYCWWPQAPQGALRVEILNRSDEPSICRLVTN